MIAQAARPGKEVSFRKKEVCKTDIENNILIAFMSAFQASTL